MLHCDIAPTHFRPCRRGVLLAFALLLATVSSARADVVIYDSLPNIPAGTGGLPGNVVSLGYEATSTSEFGDRIGFAAGPRALSSATVTLSDWANFANFPNMNSAGWSHPLTLNLYTVNHTGQVPTVGQLIYSTGPVSFPIPWHGNNGFNGTAFNVTFNLPGVVVPDEIIYGLSFNTQNHGPNPLGTSGPYNSLNFGLHDTGVDGPIAVGTDMNPDAVFWNTTAASFYTDGGAAGVGIFRQDTAWSPNTPGIRFTALDTPTPEPASLAVFAALGLTAVGLRRRKG